MKFAKILVSITTCAVFAGCASTAQWMRPDLQGKPHAKDLATIAQTECDAYAEGTGPAPRPTQYMPTPAPSSYTTTGTYTDNGGYGSFTARTRANNSFASGYASGYNTGASIGDAIVEVQMQKRRKRLSDACMRAQGWIDASTPDGQEELKKVTLEKSIEHEKAAIAERAMREWQAAISAFFQQESARRGGIDYLNDEPKLLSFDKYVKLLANQEKNNGRNSTWFLIEAHKMVLREYGLDQ